jgi:hypothetical protein
MNLSHPAHPVSTHRQMRVSLYGRVVRRAHVFNESRDEFSDRSPARQRGTGLSAADLYKVLSVVHVENCDVETGRCKGTSGDIA